MKVPEKDWLLATEVYLDTRELPVDKKLIRAVEKFAPKLSYHEVTLPIQSMSIDYR
jgi:hypothetical protein